jgi:hypothetical protein
VFARVYPALTGSKNLSSRFIETGRKVGITARNSPIGSTNHKWGMKKSPLMEVSLYNSY